MAGRAMEAGQLRVSEVFASIQGESSHAGLPCAFVRLAGCHLRCRHCDTAYAREGGQLCSLEFIIEQVDRMGLSLVEVTGGEPLLQEATGQLLAALCGRGHTVLLETSGTLDISGVDPRVRRIVDLKPPSSGHVAANHWPNLDHLSARDEVKFVLADRADYEWCRAQLREHGIADRCPVLLGSVYGILDPRLLAKWILADRLPVRLQLQLHKVLWGSEARAV